MIFLAELSQVDTYLLIVLLFLIFIAAMLYSSVGHAGASGYLAAMALVGTEPAIMKPTALVLNVLVASLASYRYIRAGFFDFKIFIPFAIFSIPLAFLGGWLQLSTKSYYIIVGLILLFAAFRLTFKSREVEKVTPVAFPMASVCGAGIGFLSGLVGVGGGIFLSPLLLIMRWATTRVTAGISALFILVNSVSGFLGHLGSIQKLPPTIWYMVACAFAGALIGTELGVKRFATQTIRIVLSIVLVVAALKMLMA